MLPSKTVPDIGRGSSGKRTRSMARSAFKVPARSLDESDFGLVAPPADVNSSDNGGHNANEPFKVKARVRALPLSTLKLINDLICHSPVHVTPSTCFMRSLIVTRMVNSATLGTRTTGASMESSRLLQSQRK